MASLAVYLSIIFLSLLNAQTRYIDLVFDKVEITSNVIYGRAPNPPFESWSKFNDYNRNLTMDIYQPVDDVETNRPVIVFLHSGAFVAGSKQADDMVELSTLAAQRGYVAVSANYRLGLNMLSTFSGERAVYKAVQDGSAVIRFLREFHELYRIDSSKIFVWGSSAGAFIGLHLSYFDNLDRPISSFGNTVSTDLGCIDCEGNPYQHDSTPNALVSCWGAIGRLEWINQEDDVPVILFHGTEDLVVPYKVGIPFTINLLLDKVYGSEPINQRLNRTKIVHEIHTKEGGRHEYWGTLSGMWRGSPNRYFDEIQEKSYAFLYPLAVKK